VAWAVAIYHVSVVRPGIDRNLNFYNRTFTPKRVMNTKREEVYLICTYNWTFVRLLLAIGLMMEAYNTPRREKNNEWCMFVCVVKKNSKRVRWLRVKGGRRRRLCENNKSETSRVITQLIIHGD